MAATKSWYRKPEEEYQPTDYVQQGKEASEQGNWKGSSSSEFYGNYSNTMQGNPQANTYKKQTGWTMPNDYSQDVKTGMNTGMSPYFTTASNAFGNQKAWGDSDLNQFANQNDAAVADYYNANRFQYNDPYGFMDMATGMDAGVRNALSDYAGQSFSGYLAGPEYQNLADQYMQNGQLAMENTLGTASQMSGGLDSSYAVGAAQQAYNNYMTNLQDAAQQAYKLQMADKAGQLSALQDQQKMYFDAYGDDYKRAFDAYGDNDNRMYNWYSLLQNQANADRNFQYGMLTDPLTQKSNVDYGNAQLGMSYDKLAEDARQADAALQQKGDQFSQELAYKYYDSNLDSQTALQKAAMSASGSGSGGTNDPMKLANLYRQMASDAGKSYNYSERDVYTQAATMAASGDVAGAQALVQGLFKGQIKQ